VDVAELKTRSTMGSDNSTNNVWLRLRVIDRTILVILLPIWLTCLFLHIDLALNNELIRPAILFDHSQKQSQYPIVGEILSEARHLVAIQGIELGDEVLEVNGVSLEGLSGFRAGLIATAQIGQAPKIIAEFRRSDMVFKSEYPFNDLGIPAWWPSLFALSFGLVGLVVLLSAPESKTAQAIFPAFMFFSLSWVVVLGHSELQSLVGMLVFTICMMFAGPLMLRAILLMPERTAIKSPLAYRSVWIFSLMMISGLSAFTGMPFNTEIGQAMHAGFMAIFYLLILLILARNYIKADEIGRRQLRWIIFGFYLAFVPTMIVTAVIILYPDKFSLYALASVGMPLVPITFLVAITKYNLFDIDRLIGGSISYTLLIILIALLTEAVIEPLVAVTATEHGFDGDQVQLVFVGILAAILIPVQKRWRKTVNKVFFAKGVAVEDTMAILMDTIDAEDHWSKEKLFELVGDELNTAYSPDQWGIFEVNGDDLEIVSGQFKQAIPSDAWQAFARRARPSNASIGRKKNCLFAPIRIDRELKYLLVLGSKQSGDVYTTTDTGLIASLMLEMADKLS